MGNRHNVHHVSSRRRSLVKDEYDFPQPAFDFFDDDWEIYHVEVELETLPPHTRHRIKIHVHEYTQEIITCEEECSGESNTGKGEKDSVCAEEFSREINPCESDKDRLCADKDEVSEKKNRGLRPECFRDKTLCTVHDRSSSRNSDSLTKCSRCKTVLDTGFSQDDASNGKLTENRTERKETELTDTKGERRETGSVLNDMFLQWDLSLEEPCQRDHSPTKACKTEMSWDLDVLGSSRRDESSTSIRPFQNDRDVTMANTVEQCDAQRDTLETSPSSLKCDGQKTSHPSDGLPGLCDTCSSSSTHNTTAKSLPMEIPTASTMLYKIRPHLRSTRRKMSDPNLRLKTPTPLSSPKLRTKPRRKVSLKDEPGWIPNPLDSDEDEDDMEDSGVFSDATGSPRSPGRLHLAAGVSSSPTLAARKESSASTAESSAPPEPPLREYPTAAELAQRRLALQTGGRRRYNSEPTPIAPKTSSPSDTRYDSEEELVPSGNSRSSSVSDGSTSSKAQSRWRLVKLVWGRRASKADAVENATASAAASSSSGKEAEQEELELDKQLEWMTKVPNSEPPTPSEDREGIDFNSDSAASEPFRKVSFSDDTHTNLQHPSTSFPTSSAQARKVTFSETHPEKVIFSETHPEKANLAPQSHPPSSQTAKKPAISKEHEDLGGNPEGQELELDWLCEPEWNNFELELFWSVLRPHMEKLLQCGDAENLPDPCVTVFAMDARDHKMLDRCLLHVQWHIWKGNYCQAVSDFRAVRRHFRCCAESHLIQSETRDDVESLRLVFQRKRPSRFRFWI